MNMEDVQLEEAFSNVSTSSIIIAQRCLLELTKCKELELQNKLLATVPCARRVLNDFVNNVVGYPRMAIIFPAYLSELYDFINQDNCVVTFLDFNATVVTEKIANLQAKPYPAEGITIYNPHIGLTAAGYFPRLSAVTATLSLYDKWIELIYKFLSFCNDI